jgi:hypothetical protein
MALVSSSGRFASLDTKAAVLCAVAIQYRRPNAYKQAPEAPLQRCRASHRRWLTRSPVTRPTPREENPLEGGLEVGPPLLRGRTIVSGAAAITLAPGSERA